MIKVAIISGVGGQDGSYLAELLLEKNYKVVGILRRSSTPNTKNIQHILKDIIIEYGDLVDQGFLDNLIKKYKPDEFYNLAAQSYVPVSWIAPVYTAEVNALAPLKILEAIRLHKPDCRFLQASTSEQFGKIQEMPQTETTPFYPRSPYGVAKVFGHQITVNLRESYGLFGSSSITFNHESPRRSEEFVTRKITKAVARIKLGLQDELALGNLQSKRDWGYAKEYVDAFHRILQHTEPDTFVVGSGQTHTIEEFCKLAFEYVHLNYLDYVRIEPKFYRPAEVDILCSCPDKIYKILGWKAKTSFNDLVSLMVENDLKIEGDSKNG